MSLPPDPEVAPSSRALFMRLWNGYLRKHLPLMIVAFVVLVIDGSTLGLLSYLLKPLFDKVFSGDAGQGALFAVGLGIAPLSENESLGTGSPVP